MSTTTAPPGKPTVVLVHGAFAESASWDGVIAGLLGDGYPAVAVANPLRGVPHDADHLRALLTGPVVLAGRFPGSSLGETLAAVTLPGGDTDLYIQQNRYHHQFAAHSTAERAAVMAVTQRPITEAALNEPSGEPAWRSLPSWFLFGSEDLNIPVAAHRFMAERAGSRRTVEVPGGSHTVAIPEAALLVDLIRAAAGAS
ncbi:alpha/beta fold hydrolase [Micromonospora sp. NBC_00421]|uniref:alpha/beta fold hydrolase n=1 Tax=Micromonospora sp. NBC_00421 TaxID=2975976 RepID=UPI002E24EEE7